MTEGAMPTNARAAASRRNGARSRGPKTAAGRRRAARNALKHGLCARKLVLLTDEDSAAFGAFEAAVHAELAPVGALQADLVARVAVAAWRARRADRLEAALLRKLLGMAAASFSQHDPQSLKAAFGLEVIRDCNGPRALETLLRYRGSVFAELFRSLAVLKGLQAEVRAPQPLAALPAGLAVPASTTKRTREMPKNQAIAE